MVGVCLWAGYPVGLISQHRRLPVIAIMSMVDRAVGLLLSLADLEGYLSVPKPILVIDSAGGAQAGEELLPQSHDDPDSRPAGGFPSPA